MGKCVFCFKETNETVNDNLGSKSHLCENCQNEFEKCKVCNENYLKEEMKDGLCKNCV